jgi:formamidopyrimidine-DNA glycosylase
MVEGPGATRNARKLQPAVGCIVIESGTDHTQWVGETLVEVFSVGKEVFLIFNDDCCIRLHFGMNGSLYLTNENSSARSYIPEYKQKQGASLQFKLKRSEDDCQTILLDCFLTTVCTVTARIARSKQNRLAHLDCCAPEETFDCNSVVQAIRTRPTAMICDAILDQNRFPGVGNVIKIEGLHAAKVNIKRLVQDLSTDELKSVVQECRRYALGWLKSGRAPKKQVYNQTFCGTCQQNVRMVKIGNDLSRVTFWCEQCQPVCDISTHTEDSMVSANNKRPQSAETVISRPTKLTKVKEMNPLQEQRQHRCPQHGSQTICIKRVRKSPKEENRNRLFVSCKVKSCPFFAWADTHFPSCQTCKTKTILRVSKKEQSSGRWFFSCPKQECRNSFAWAMPDQVLHFGKHLTPLL